MDRPGIIDGASEADKARLKEFQERTRIEVMYKTKPEELPAKILQLAQYVSTRNDLPEHFKKLMSEYLCINAHLHVTDKIKKTESFNAIYDKSLFHVPFKDRLTRDDISPDLAKTIVKGYRKDMGMTRDEAKECLGQRMGKSSGALSAYMNRKRKGNAF